MVLRTVNYSHCSRRLTQFGHMPFLPPYFLRHQQQTVVTRRRTLHLLQHWHMKPGAANGATEKQLLVPYDDADALQEDYRSQFLDWKAKGGARQQTWPSPNPHLISLECTPTYTLGRRQINLDISALERLKQPLQVFPASAATAAAESINADQGDGGSNRSSSISYQPQVKKTNRGGLTTYHGPGQLVLWPIIDLHSPLHARFSVASYVRLLETTTQRLLADLFALETHSNPDEPGVWMGPAPKSSVGAGGQVPSQGEKQERKIAALGVHLRRYVTGLGIALNVNVPVTGIDESVNPWARFVPCGLQGKGVTSVAAELDARLRGGGAPAPAPAPTASWDMQRLATQWAERFEAGLLQGGIKVE